MGSDWHQPVQLQGGGTEGIGVQLQAGTCLQHAEALGMSQKQSLCAAVPLYMCLLMCALVSRELLVIGSVKCHRLPCHTCEVFSDERL